MTADPMVLRLPEVPEGATLVGLTTGYRWAEHPLGGWVCPDRGPISLGRLLQSAEPKGVRVELAPPREPRTVAEIWCAMPDAQVAVRGLSSELAEALDREAGL